MRRAITALAALSCLGCGEAGPYYGRESALEREAREWLEGDRDPGQGNVLVSVERVFFDGADQEGIEILFRWTGRRASVVSPARPWARASEAAEGFEAELRAMERSGRVKGLQTAAAAAVTGGEAEIFMGTEEAFVPFGYAGVMVGAPLERRRVGCSLVVRPRMAEGGTAVLLELLPRFSASDGSGSVTVEEARTTVLARPGVPVVIGGVTSQTRGIERWIFGAAASESAKGSVMIVTVRLGGAP